MGSASRMAKRMLVKLLFSLAAAYSIPLSINRDTPDVDVRATYAKVWRRASRNRMEDARLLKEAKVAWEQALAARAQVGRPSVGEAVYRINAVAVLLTYQSVRDIGQWTRFVVFLQPKLLALGVKHWCATLEACKSGSYHIHLMLQFKRKVDRTSCFFAFEGIQPNVSSNDILGQGVGGRNAQQSYNRGFFYVYADKIGTVVDAQGEACTVGNYAPAWVDDDSLYKYQVLGKWPEALWKQYKLQDATYERYLFLCRDGTQARKRNLDFCKAWKEAQNEQAEIETVTKRIKGNPAIYQPFPEVPEVTAWLQIFLGDLLRYPLLILLGQSATGKTEFAKSLFQHPLELKVCNLETFPSKIVDFKRGHHDALILDDVRDLEFLVSHQEKLQGKYDGRIEFATTQGGTCFFTKYLYQVPTVVTINFTTRNLRYLSDNDWLSKAENRVFLKWPVQRQQ